MQATDQQISGRGNGADDEDTGSDSEGDVGQAEVVGGCRDHRGHGPDDAAVARAVRGARLQRVVGPPQADSRARSGCRWKNSEQVLHLYREKYFDFNVLHFHEKLREEHGIQFSYSWVKTALQEAGLGEETQEAGLAPQAAAAAAAAGHDAAHRRQRAPLVSGRALLRADLVIMDDATSEIYYAQLVEAESTRTRDGGTARGDRDARRVLLALQ